MEFVDFWVQQAITNGSWKKAITNGSWKTSLVSHSFDSVDQEGTPFVWSKAYKDSFQNLTILDGFGNFITFSDASKKSLCCVLMQ